MNLLPVKVFEFGEIKTIKENIEIDWGTLVGVVNKPSEKEDILP